MNTLYIVESGIEVRVENIISYMWDLENIINIFFGNGQIKCSLYLVTLNR